MMIPHSRPWITEADYEALAAGLRPDASPQGTSVQHFEATLAATVGQRYGVATSSGTAALHLALLALGVSDGDEVILPAYACTALANAVHCCRAVPVLCDVDPNTGNLDGNDMRKRLTARTRAILVVHMFGHPADLSWRDWVELPVIEDCAQALGAGWQGRPVGSLGTISIYSFYSTKVISTGVGGMACCSSDALAEKMWDLREYDQRQDYVIRYGYKMSDFQAGLGLAQLARLPQMIARRRALAKIYDTALADKDIRLPQQDRRCAPIYYRYVIQAKQVDLLALQFAAHQVECKRPVFRPLHHYSELAQSSTFVLPGAEQIYSQALSIPLYPALAEEEVQRIISTAKKVLDAKNALQQPARKQPISSLFRRDSYAAS